jgi:aerobic-type carbon monoxide dehydrogenase small subunit (CoxS/CutS family)
MAQRKSLNVNGKAVRITIDDPDMPLLYALRDNLALHGPQCGYCINGMIMESAAFLATTKKPTEAQVKDALANNLCRCGTHARIVKAVMRAAGA